MYDPVGTYKRAHTEGLSQRDLIVMCYKGTINFLEQARTRHHEDDLESFSELVEKAHRAIFHLYTTLDMERGGEVAVRLAEFYTYVISKLYVCSATKDLATIEHLIELLGTVKEGWETMDLSSLSEATESRQQQQRQKSPQMSVSVEG
jgi:flagellar protein FliS